MEYLLIVGFNVHLDNSANAPAALGAAFGTVFKADIRTLRQIRLAQGILIFVRGCIADEDFDVVCPFRNLKR